ncbi:MAG: hypothetical protein V1760_00505 [Candidatus Peregrinibacteria bacterium]
MDKTTLVGASGATIILIAFILNQTGRWKNEYFIYDLFNFVGSVVLIIYAVILSSYPFMVLNFVWGAVSLRDIFADLIRNSRKKERGFFGKWFK